MSAAGVGTGQEEEEEEGARRTSDWERRGGSQRTAMTGRLRALTSRRGVFELVIDFLAFTRLRINYLFWLLDSSTVHGCALWRYHFFFFFNGRHCVACGISVFSYGRGGGGWGLLGKSEFGYRRMRAGGRVCFLLVPRAGVVLAGFGSSFLLLSCV